jgi:multidrug resistance efflux pump
VSPAPTRIPEEELASPGGDGAVDDDRPPDEPEAKPRDEVGQPAVRRLPPRRRLMRIGLVVVLVAAAGIGYAVWQASKRVKIDEATLTAPTIPLPAHAGGTLRRVYASVGDDVRAHRPIAWVGNEAISSDVPGTVISIRDDLGAQIAPGTTVATLINRNQLRAVGKIAEDEGLADLRIGQRATVEVDAFGGKKFSGWVEEISAVPARQDVKFAISNKREERDYEVKVRFDGVPDPGFRQGMSARIWVHK